MKVTATMMVSLDGVCQGSGAADERLRNVRAPTYC